MSSTGSRREVVGHRALATGRDLPPPQPGPVTGLPADETALPHDVSREFVHDRGEKPQG